MLKLARELEYDIAVDVRVPGSKAPQRFTARCRALRQPQVRALIEDGPPEGADLRLLRQAVVGWRELADEDGQEIEFSAEALEDLLEVIYVRTALGTAYIRSLGLPEAERKN